MSGYFLRFLVPLRMLIIRTTSIFLIAIVALSCNRHHVQRVDYSFKSATGTPDYSDLDYWAAHPWKWDPSDSIPAPLRNEPIDSTVDVFFLHPTMLTSNKSIDRENARIDDPVINRKTDYTSILYQASVFNQQCRVFAPRYREAHLQNFYNTDTVATSLAFNTAYKDITDAFDYYLEHYNNGHPIIIAGHSQGSKLAERLLKQYFEDKPLRNKLVVTYLAGWPVPKDYFSSLPMCRDSIQTGCICSWRTFRKGYIPDYLKGDSNNAYATNPLTWTTNNEYAGKNLHRGSVLTKFNKVYKHTTDAQVMNGLLYIKKPKFPWSFLYFTKNYHVGDINLFYMNIREDVRRRIGLYWKQ